jgi:hypothetical protein
MERQELTEKLSQLHAELSQADRVDPEALELLGKLTEDIRRIEQGQEPAAAVDEEMDVAGGLKELLMKFEAEHPQLSITVGKVADALATLGI